MPEKPTFENESYYYEGVMTIAENMAPKPDPQICAVPSSEEAVTGNLPADLGSNDVSQN